MANVEKVLSQAKIIANFGFSSATMEAPNTEIAATEPEVFIKKITIENVRHLHGVEILLSETERKHLILTGKNGSGKTSVLENIKRHIENIIFNKDLFKSNGYTNKSSNSPDFVKDIYDYFGSSGAPQKHELIILSFNLRNSFESNTNIINEIISGIKLRFNYIDSAYYSANNLFVFAHFPAQRNQKFEIPKGPFKFDIPEKFSANAEISKYFIQFLLNQKADASFSLNENETDEAEKINQWFDMLIDKLKFLYEEPNLELIFNRKDKYSFKIKIPNHEPFTFNEVSEGYAAIFSILAELIIRIETKYNSNYNIQGIVLIDEIDIHLHVSLQKKILPFLTAFFPRIQFIVTTHSPFVLSSVSNAVIYDLENNIRVEDLSGYSGNGIVESYFMNDDYSAKIKDDFEKYKMLCEKLDITKDEEREKKSLRLKLNEVPRLLAVELKDAFLEYEVDRKLKEIA